MLGLFLSVCLISDPGKCKEEKINMAEETTFNQCMGDQVDIAKWIGDHPNFTIQKWTCKPVGQEANL
jgi:hypothetical protein